MHLKRDGSKETGKIELETAGITNFAGEGNKGMRW